MTTRTRVLFMAEAVTLAHVARPLALAKGLDPDIYEIHLACAQGYDAVMGNCPYHRTHIQSVSPEQFRTALARGRPLYDVATLRAYVEEDLHVLRTLRPDVVVGDFRLSLSVSARLAGIPYITITNAYWSPYRRQPIPVPDLPLTRTLGVGLAQTLFDLARPFAFALHSRPLNRVRQEHHLSSLGPDLRRVYTDADYTLYADPAELFPLATALPDHHQFIGPLLWSPEIALPAWWNEISTGRPCVYVTLGSSGEAKLLPLILEALADEPITVIAASAGQQLAGPLPDNARVAGYLPGIAAAQRAQLVICNGGSPTSQQALAAGVPVVGVPSNLDQHLNMVALQQARVGHMLRSESLRSQTVRNTVREALADRASMDRAAAMADIFKRYSAPERFAEIVAQVTTHG